MCDQNMQKKLNYITWIPVILYLHKIEDIYVDTAKNVETRFDTSNYVLGRPLPKETKKNY